MLVRGGFTRPSFHHRDGAGASASWKSGQKRSQYEHLVVLLRAQELVRTAKSCSHRYMYLLHLSFTIPLEALKASSMQATMIVQKPYGEAEVLTEIENAAHILLQAMMAPLPAHSDTSSPQQNNNSETVCTEVHTPLHRQPLTALDRNKSSQSSIHPPLQSKALQKYVPPVEALHFPDQDSFEDWAIDRLAASHPEVVIEKKRR